MAASSGSDRGIFGFALWKEVLAGLVLGVLAGLFFKDYAESMKTLGKIFINLIKMVVTPLIFLALVSGITSLSGAGSAARVGFKGVVAYSCTSFFAVVLGLVMANIFNPGIGISIDPAIFGDASASSQNVPSLGAFFMSLVPTNAVRMFTEDHYLQIVLFSVFTGIVINMLGPKGHHARDVLQGFSAVTFKMIELIVRLAPIAVFGFIAWMVGTQGMDIIHTLIWLVVCFLAACLLQMIVFGVLIAVFGRISPMPFFKKMGSTQLLAFSTSSSKATLATAMTNVETKLGVSEQTVKFMMPLGASMNMDGTAIYLGICAVFFAQVFGVHLELHDYLILVLTCTLGSIGAAGIPSGSIIFMGMVLNSVGLPLEGIGILLGIDRLLDMVRTTINITGDAAITLIVDASEGTLDHTTYNA
jgi:Na+/H+-dicarboxylate symporter